jgi:hypothetical protein
MKLLETISVTGSALKFIIIKNLTQMQSFYDWKHSVLQRLIIVFLGLLTLGALMQSCAASYGTCAAYNEVEKTETK